MAIFSDLKVVDFPGLYVTSLIIMVNIWILPASM